MQVTKKCSKENMPSMNKYSESSSAPDATHTVSYDRVFKKGDEEVDEEEYAPEDMGKAYKVISDQQSFWRATSWQQRLSAL